MLHALGHAESANGELAAPLGGMRCEAPPMPECMESFVRDFLLLPQMARITQTELIETILPRSRTTLDLTILHRERNHHLEFLGQHYSNVRHELQDPWGQVFALLQLAAYHPHSELQAERMPSMRPYVKVYDLPTGLKPMMLPVMEDWMEVSLPLLLMGWTDSADGDKPGPRRSAFASEARGLAIKSLELLKRMIYDSITGPTLYATTGVICACLEFIDFALGLAPYPKSSVTKALVC